MKGCNDESNVGLTMTAALGSAVGKVVKVGGTKEGPVVGIRDSRIDGKIVGYMVVAVLGSVVRILDGI